MVEGGSDPPRRCEEEGVGFGHSGSPGFGHHPPLHTRTRLVTRQDVSSRRSTSSSNQWTFTVVHIDGDNTDTEATALPQVLRL